MDIPRPRLKQSNTTNVRFGRLAIVVLVLLALSAVVTIFGSKDAADAAGAIGVMTGTGVAGWLFICRARVLEGRERLGWTLVGVGMAIASLGVLVVGLVYFIQGDAPAFGWTDIFFLVTYTFVIVGAAVLPQVQGSGMQRVRMVLDGLIGAVSIAALFWVFLLADLTSDLSDSSLLTQVIGAVYPFLDLAILTVAMSVLLRRSRHRFDVRVALFSVAVFFQVLGDITFFAAGQAGSFQDVNPVYWINLLATAFFITSAAFVAQPSVGREYADRNPPLWTQVGPYLPAFGMLAVFVYEVARRSDMVSDTVLLAAVIIVGLLVIARQGVSILENRATIEEQRDLLVTTISHELRTPLTAIVGYVELFAEDPETLTEDQRAMIEIVHEQADYMSTIVSDLIMLARGTKAGLELDIETVAVDELAMSSVHASGIGDDTVVVDGVPGLMVAVDASRMQQVLVNLLSNAARYGGGQRRLRVVSDGSDVTFEVHDNGSGVPRRYEERIWERFERGPNRLNAVTPGSGIGLAVVRAIAEAHGGTTAYRTSEFLGGACFSVWLPGCASRRPIDVAEPEAADRIRSIA
jgi:signal transduction histidine kinase